MQAVADPVLDPALEESLDGWLDLALAAAVARLDAADDGEVPAGDVDAWPGLDVLWDREPVPGPAGLRGVCERLAAAPPGPDTLAALGVLSTPGVLAGLDEAGRVLLAAAWERAAAWVAACTAVVLVAADDAAAGDATLDGPDGRWVSDELRAALRWSAVTANRRLDTARAWTGVFPGTLAALAAGSISVPQALIVVEELAALAATDPATAAAVETSLLARAPTQTAAQTRRAARRRAATAAPALLDARAAAAARRRGVFLVPEPDGMATLSAVLPAPEALACYRAIDDAARTRPVTGENDCDVPGRPRIGDARADALLVALLGPAPSAGDGPDRDGAALTGPPAAPAVELAVVIDLPTLLGLAQTPAQLPGYGPLPAPVARALAGHAPWRRWVTDPVTGHLLDYGRTTYRPPAPLAAYIHARDATCRFPGCARRATASDLDHLQPYHPDRDDGGPTSAANLGATCRAHHQLKTHHGWSVTRTPDGTDHWTSPTGLTYPVPRPPADPRHPDHPG